MLLKSICGIRGLAERYTDINRSSQDGRADSTTPGMHKIPWGVNVSDLVPLAAFCLGRVSAAEERKSTDTNREEIVLVIVKQYLITLST